MFKSALVLLIAAACVAGCSKSPQDQQADRLRAAADAKAQQIRDQAAPQIQAMNDQSKALAAQAKSTGGYTGERLKVQADSLSRQADILDKQARAQADATREAADAQAKQIASR